MQNAIVCPCGKVNEFPDNYVPPGATCSACGCELSCSAPPIDFGLEPDHEPVSAGPDSTPRLDAEPPMFLRMLLDPKTIQRLLLFGGGLSVLGLVAWLISMGVFEDPLILASALGLGSVAILGSGWGVTLKTQHRLAGQALTFLGCVVAPLNLWFYQTQGLLTVDGHLWVAASICSLCYVLTVCVLKDPLFLYAVESGVTLTTMLMLGSLQCASDSIAVCVALTSLGLISIHAESVFDPNSPDFSRKKFGLPLFFSGQVQLGAAMASLLVMQVFYWALTPSTGFGFTRLAETPWVAGILWMIAAYAWFYSDFAVRKISGYSYLAAMALILAEVTFCYDYLNVEGLIFILSATVLTVQLIVRSTTDVDSRLSQTTERVGVWVAGIPFVIGVFHYLGAAWNGHDVKIAPIMFPLSMIAVAVAQIGQSVCRRSQQNSTKTGDSALVISGVSIWIAFLSLMTRLDWTHVELLIGLFAVLLGSMGILASKKAAASQRYTVYRIAKCCLILSCLANFSALVEAVFGFWPRDIRVLQGAILLAEFGAMMLIVPVRGGRAWWLRIVGCLFELAAVGKFLVYLSFNEVWYGVFFAGIGVIALAVERIRLMQIASSPAIDEHKSTKSYSSMWETIGDATLVIAELMSFLQSMSFLLGTAKPAGEAYLAFSIATGLAGIGAVLAPSSATRRWHTFAAFAILATLGLTVICKSDLANYQKVEIAAEVLGVLLLSAGSVGRLSETEKQKDPSVGVSLALGSIAATLPILFCTLKHRFSFAGPLLIEELALITIATLMIAIGCVLQIRSTTTFGVGTIVLYLVILFADLAYRPQIAISAYLAAGGAVIFVLGVILSIYRDRLLALPTMVAQRKGLFQIIDWR